MKLSNLLKALKYQLPLKRLFKNFFITGNAWGMFSKWSHYRKTGDTKVMYNTLESAQKAALSMSKKYTGAFRPYKCIWCDGFHVGKNKK